MNRISPRLLNLRVGWPAPASWPPERLGLLERWYAAQPEPRVAGCVVELESRVDEGTLAAALARLRERHATALGVGLRRGRDAEWTFERRPGAPLPLGVESVAGQAAGATPGVWSFAERELATGFPADGLLWRVRLVEGGRAVVAVFHHAIADGVSTSIFARELLALLGGSSLGGAEPRLPLDARLDLRPPLALFAREAAGDLRKTAAPFLRGPSFDLGPRATRLYPFEVPSRVVRALSERARAEGTTVHAALCAAGMMAAGHGAEFPVTMRVLSPISLRPRATPSPAGMGVFLCAHETDVRLDRDASFWRVAASYGRELGAALPDAYQRLGMLRFTDLAARASRLSREHPNARTGTLEVSNLGRLAGLAPARVWFVQGNHYHGPLYNVTAGTCSESFVLRAALCVAEPVVKHGAAAFFVREMLATLERAAGESDRPARLG